MKKQSLLLLTALAAMCAFSSCKKETVKEQPKKAEFDKKTEMVWATKRFNEMTEAHLFP